MTFQKNLGRALVGALALAGVFALTLPTATLAGEVAGEQAEAAEVTLQGQLSESAAGAYVLVEAASGDAIALRGSEADLAAHLGSAVAVTGSWAVDENGDEYFAVSAVEAA